VRGRGDSAAVEAIASDWRVWVLALLTGSVASPWLRLRRVPVTVERPSSHAAIVGFDYGVTPAFASAVGISRSPLREWHAFATVTTPGRSGYRLLVSHAGDWTRRFIDDPPSHVWLRGTPTSAPMAKVALLYERVVYIVTGSGIGPCLGQILAARVPARLVWSTRDPRATYGDELVDEIEAAQPDAVIWDTTRQGKPDLVELARSACRDFDAEAVFVVSNKSTTRRLVHGLERLGSRPSGRSGTREPGSSGAHRIECVPMPVVRDHMSRNLLSVEPGASLTEVAQRMVERNLGSVLVLEEGRLVGIMTERDLMRAVARGVQGDAVVGDYMSRDPETVEPGETTEHAAVLMIHGGFRHLPVVEGDDVVGMLSIRDLMRVALEDSVPRGV
jgi:CBS domain-containing protein